MEFVEIIDVQRHQTVFTYFYILTVLFSEFLCVLWSPFQLVIKESVNLPKLYIVEINSLKYPFNITVLCN